MEIAQIAYIVTVAIHVLCAAVAFGCVIVTDYVHLFGLWHKKFEKKVLFLYPHFTRIILAACCGILITGVALLIQRPELLSKPIFQLKMSLVLIITLNSIVLIRYVTHKLMFAISRNKKFTQSLLISSSACGVISLVSWVSIFFLTLTKELNYHIGTFITIYLCAILGGVLTALILENLAHGTKHHKNN